jgi:hypothetical protein
MKRVAILTVVALLAWQGYGQLRAYMVASAPATLPGAVAPPPAAVARSDGFRCDGRTHCAQMTSCAEARFFQRNCPDVDLELDKDGDPCPRRWCNAPNSP